MPLEEDQLSFTLGGIPFGDIDEFGVDWSIEKFDGWGGSPASTAQITQRVRRSGGLRSTGYSAARSIAASGKVFAPDAASLSAAFDRLNDAIPAGIDRVLTVSDAAGERWVPVQRSDDVLTDYILAETGTWSLQVQSEDWRKFGTAVSDDTKLPSTVGGLTIPFTIPFTIAATTVSGQVHLTNPGNETGPVTLRIDGPCVGPVITHTPTGAVLAFRPSLVLRADEFLLVDMDAHSALANGQAGRSGYIASRGWSGFEPGENTWAFTAAQYSPDATLTVTAVPSWK